MIIMQAFPTKRALNRVSNAYHRALWQIEVKDKLYAWYFMYTVAEIS